MRRVLGAAILLLIAGALLYLLRARHASSHAHVSRADVSHTNISDPSISHARERSRPLYLSDVSVQEERRAQAGSIEGHVLSAANGRAVAGALLSFARGTDFDVTADGEGHFRFVPPAPGSYQLVAVSARGFLPFAAEPGASAVRFEARPGVRLDGVTIYLAPAQRITVVVKEPSGRPAVAAEVRAFSDEHGRDGAATATTDGKGEAVVEAGAADTIEARKSGFLRARGRVDFAAQATGRIVLTLGAGSDKPLGSIGGRVVDGAGQAVEGALVEAIPPRAGSRDEEKSGARALSDGNGRFTLALLDGGSYDLRARASGRGSVELRNVATGRDDVELRLAARGGIRGTVSDGNGKPIAAFTVVAWPRLGSLARGEPMSSSVFSGDGKYELELPAGEWIVSAAAHGFAPAREQSVSVGADFVTRDFSLGRGGRVFGRVVDRQSGAAIPGARVLLEGYGGDGLTLTSDTSSDGSGSFSIGGIAPGRQSLEVFASGHDGRIVSGIDVPSDGEVGPLGIDLRPLAPGEEPKLELQGIGAVLAAGDDGLLIKAVMPTGGAAAAGVVPGDVIVAIEDTPVEQIGFPGAIQMLRGPEGSTVNVTVRHVDGSQGVITIARRRLNG